ncbi:MAG TPA: hypothetical protein VGT40_24555 [Methylomirabilota bacterium]|jgi:hypothetical protein|nr:hypothetical protein [Methylomirabilota bacterium]
MPKRLSVAGLALVAVLVGLGTPAWAQAGFYITPSLSLAEEFDDNVFVTPTGKKSDFITRFIPGIELGYRSEPFTLLARSSFDAEIYARNTELSDAATRKRAALEAKYLPYRLLTLGLNVSYIDTNTPSGLTAAAGVQLGRTKATELIVAPSAVYQFTPLDSGRLAYSFIHDTIEGGPTANTHRIEPSFAHQFTTLDTGAFHYRASVFQSEDARTVSSHAPMVAWIRQLTPLTFLTLRAGPRFIDDGSVQPEAFGSLEHRFRLAKVRLEYVRTDAVLLGHPGPVELETIAGSAEFEPLRLLAVKIEPTYSRTFGGVLARTPTFRVYGIAASAAYPITNWLTARLTYRFSYQQESGPDLTHNLVTISLDAAYPIRIGQ